MHAMPFAAQPPDGHATTEPATSGVTATPLRICIYAAQTPDAATLAALRERLPQDARLVLVGACAASEAWPQAERLSDVEGRSPIAVAITAAQRFPGEHLLLVRADLALPEFACERLLRALDGARVLGAVALDSAQRRPLPRDTSSTADAAQIDALCYAWSDRRLCDDPYFFAGAPAWLCAWHGARLAELGPERLRERDAVEASGLRIVLLDHLYVATATTLSAPPPPEHDPHDPAPPSPLVPLQQRVAAALASGSVPARPGLDGKPVLLHVLHGWGGGAERWVRDYAGADAGAHHLVLIARGSFARRRHGEWLELHDGGLSGTPLRRWPLPRPIADTALGDASSRDLFMRILHDYCVDAVVVSSLIGHSLDALRSGLPLVCVVHDHYPLWPSLHRDFGDAALPFDDAQRAADLRADASDGEFDNRDAPHWRRLRDETVAALLAAKASLAAPSRSALHNQLRLAPELRALPAQVIAHGLAPWPARAPRIEVGPA
ncbi:MAG: hypothetical protein ABW187_07580, partial [Dokdonella sp.]